MKRMIRATLAAALLAATLRTANAAYRGDAILSDDQAQTYSNIVQVVAKKKPHGKPAPPPPPPALCPPNSVAGKGHIAWDDLKESFKGAQGLITDANDFAADFPGKWIKVGEAKSRTNWGRYDPEGLLDGTDCWYDYCSSQSRTGWIATYENTSGPLGSPHYGLQSATFDRYHKAKGGSKNFPAEFETRTVEETGLVKAGVVYKEKGHPDSDDDRWIPGWRREIRIIKPKPGDFAFTAVMRESRLGDGDNFLNDDDYPEQHKFIEYCKVSN